jgi:hypothetical protein
MFGSLSEFSFLEIINMIQQRTGVLRVTQTAAQRVLECAMENGRLRALRLDFKVVTDEEEAKTVLLEIAAERQGDFVFHRRPLEQSQKQFFIAVTELLSKSTVLDDLFQESDQLPNAQTRFMSVNHYAGDLTYDLQLFWQRAHSLLARGASAEEITDALTLDQNKVRMQLQGLRIAGAIRPVRRIEEESAQRQQNVPQPNTAQPSTTQPFSQPAEQRPFITGRSSQPPVPTVDLEPVTKPTLVSRLLGALSFMRRTS